MSVPLIDLAAQYRSIQSEVDQAVRQVFERAQFILGPNVAQLEREIADYVGTEYAVGVASGTDALLLALRALEIGPGDEVVVPSYTFFATAEAVILAGATPVFVDVELDTYCLNAQQVAERLTPRTKAVIPVHLYGHPVDMGPLMELARARGVKVIEDNAQALGSEYQGRRTGGLGDVGCLSFFPSKNLGAAGDGGMVVTNDGQVAERVRMLRTHGWRKKYHPEMIGYNSRLDELQAAILRVKLPHLAGWNERRRELAQKYTERLRGLGIGVPHEAPYARHIYHLYMIQVRNRDKVQEQLTTDGIGSALYYPQPLHLVEPCKDLAGSRGNFPVSEAAAQSTLAIPLYPEMSESQFEAVVSSLAKATL
jgi:dTDP-4-amino-4,6-dideoxygalactose transaminase